MEKIKKFIMSGGGWSLNIPELFVRGMNDLYCRQALTAGTLAIIGAANPGAKTTTTITAVIDGKLRPLDAHAVTILARTAMLLARP